MKVTGVYDGEQRAKREGKRAGCWDMAESSAIFSLSDTQLVLGASLTFVLNFFSTVLPIMIFIYSPLLPRYLKLTNSRCLSYSHLVPQLY